MPPFWTEDEKKAPQKYWQPNSQAGSSRPRAWRTSFLEIRFAQDAKEASAICSGLTLRTGAAHARK